VKRNNFGKSAALSGKTPFLKENSIKYCKYGAMAVAAFLRKITGYTIVSYSFVDI